MRKNTYTELEVYVIINNLKNRIDNYISDNLLNEYKFDIDDMLDNVLKYIELGSEQED